MARALSSRWMRWNGKPQPYFKSAIIAAAVSSYFASPTPAGGSAVNTVPHNPQRSRSSS